jgi:uncharacterized membrane protein YeaQ/YmgE (transglycosylase-associated protein family)
MGVIAWIILGLLVGTAARMLVPGRAPHGLAITALIGVAGALLGGLLAALFRVSDTYGFFNLATWISAITGAVVLLFAYQVISGRRSGQPPVRRAGRI